MLHRSASATGTEPAAALALAATFTVSTAAIAVTAATLAFATALPIMVRGCGSRLAREVRMVSLFGLFCLLHATVAIYASALTISAASLTVPTASLIDFAATTFASAAKRKHLC